MRLALLVCVLAWASLPAAASAQECMDGRTRVDGRHCCWPGQQWSASARLCEGVPQCPPGTAEEGESCVPRPVAVTPPPPPTASPMMPLGMTTTSAPAPQTDATSLEGWPRLELSPDVVANPVLSEGTDMDMLIAGVVTLGSGAVLVALGPVLLAAKAGGGSIPFFACGGVAMVVGTVILVFVDTNFTSEVVSRDGADLGGGVSLGLGLDAPGSDVGANVHLSF